MVAILDAAVYIVQLDKQHNPLVDRTHYSPPVLVTLAVLQKASFLRTSSWLIYYFSSRVSLLASIFPFIARNQYVSSLCYFFIQREPARTMRLHAADEHVAAACIRCRMHIE
jgi:hypothetical protein